MRYEGLTLEVANFIDDYKIKKVKESVKKIRKFYEDLRKEETDELSDLGKKEAKRRLDNLFNPIDVDDISQYIESSMPIGENLFFTSNDKEQKNQWKNDLSALKQKWHAAQRKDDYKSQSLKTAISKNTLKSLKNISGYDNHEDQVKAVIDRAVDQVWLSFDLDVFLINAKKELSVEQINAIEAERQKWKVELQGISSKYDYANWLDEASQNAANVSFSTHVAKLTHSSIKASSVYFRNQDSYPQYLTTSALHNKTIDVSQTDNKYAPIGKFLQLESGNSKMADKLIESDVSDLAVFAKDENQQNQWQQGFLNAFKDKQPSSHSLAKQIYYPVGNNIYHLISPLASSSLDQMVFERIKHIKFDETSIEIRQHKRNKKYHSNLQISHPNIAILKVTASNPGNASPLNGIRGGKRYLLPATPPHWKSSLKPPINKQDMFYGEFDARAWETSQSLQKFLLALQDKKSSKRIRDHVKKCVNDIISTLFQYVAEIQNMTEQAGWSEQASRLKESHQLWLDPYRHDEQFQQARKRGDWQDDVCYDFGLWLNGKLRHDKMAFEKLEARSWADILKKRLREFERDLEVMS